MDAKITTTQCIAEWFKTIISMVFINGGFGGIKYFQEKENAENYIRENGGTLEIESATPQEYFNLDFSDPIKEDYF